MKRLHLGVVTSGVFRKDTASRTSRYSNRLDQPILIALAISSSALAKVASGVLGKDPLATVGPSGDWSNFAQVTTYEQ